MAHTVKIELKDDDESVSLDIAEDEYVLDVAEEAGLELPHSCRSGACTSCVARLEEGDVDRDGIALEQSQEDDGYVLLCTASPLTDCRFVAGPEVQTELFGGIDLDSL